MLSKLKVIGAAIETTQGTAVSLSATDFIEAMDVEVEPESELIEVPRVSSSLDPFAQITGKKNYNVKFKTFLKGSGDADLGIPPLDALLQSCGLTSTASANVSVTYAPTSAAASANFYGPGKSVTVKSYEGAAASGLLKVVAGAMFNPKFILEAGKPAIIEFSGKGKYTAVADAAFPSNSPVLTDPPIVQSCTFTTQTYAAIISKLEIDFGNEISPRDDVHGATGILGYHITGRKPTGSIDPELVLVATHDYYGKVAAGTTGQLQIVLGSGTGLIWTITCPKVQYGNISPGDRGGVHTLSVPLIFSRSSGDDWISIVMT
jgi:hypothetical protein